MRLFAALPLSPEAIERLTRFRLRLSGPNDGLRWSTPEQWHITLQFYGEVDEERARCLAGAFTHFIVQRAPEVVLDGLERFPAKGILYASVALSPSLQLLQSDVAELGRTCGFVPEPRPFRPHITLARSKGRTGFGTLDRLARPELPSFGTEIRWMADELLLLRSVLRPQGAEYVVTARAKTRDGGARSSGVS